MYNYVYFEQAPVAGTWILYDKKTVNRVIKFKVVEKNY